MANVEEDYDYILHGPAVEYASEYTSVGKFIFDHLKKDPEFVGQIEPDTGNKYSHAEILDRSIRLALWLRDVDIGPGDVVSYVTPYDKNVLVVIYATLFAGAVLSPLNASLTIHEIARIMDRTKPKLVICSKEVATGVKAATEKIHAAPILAVHGELAGFISFEDTQIRSKMEIYHFQCTEVGENDIALLMCTSGTTELPKVVIRSQKSVLITIQAIKENPSRGSVFMTFAPMSWVSTISSVFVGPSAKLHHVIAPCFNPELAWKWIEEYQVNTILLTTHTFLRMIYSHAVSNYDISSLQVVSMCGATLSPLDYEKFDEITPVGCEMRRTYGMTEMGGMVCAKAGTTTSGSVGSLFPGVSAKIIDPCTGKTISPYELGELCLKHPKMFTGYYKDPVRTESVLDSDGWYHTGDLAKFNKNRELFVIERLQDIVMIDGLRVVPSELEAILRTHPGVKHVGVIGKRVLSDVEHPVAFVVKAPGSNVTENELCNFLKAQVEVDIEKLRCGIKFIDKIARSTSGKVKRWELQKLLQSET